jgi:hypothetical protein
MASNRFVISKLIASLVVFAIGILVGVVVISIKAQSRAGAIDITAEQFEAVAAASGGDDSLRIVDVGKYLIGVGMNHRTATNRTGGRGGGNGNGGNAGNQGRSNGAAQGRNAAGNQGGGAGGRGNTGGGRGNAPACGVAGTPSADAVSGAVMHTGPGETYVIMSGGGVLATGGHIVNGRASLPDEVLQTIQNGPSCVGALDGPGVVRRMVKAGDAVIIPPFTPHVWVSIPDHVDYVSVRTDPDKVMTHDFVHPVVQKMLEKK